MKIKLAQYIANFLTEHGVTHNFTVTGGGAMHLNDAFGHQDGLKCIYNHHEQACAIAAEAYARLTNKIALLCVTSGPGGTNALTGVMGGWLDSIPMFVISGQVKRETTTWSTPDLKLRQLGDQEFNITKSVENMTKYCVMVTEPNEIAFHLEKAWFLCKSGRPGPVWLDIPLDVQGATIETEELKHFEPKMEENPISTQDAKSILEKVANAKRPVLLVGGGIRLSSSYNEMCKLIEKLKIPVLTDWNANDLVAFDSPYFAGMPSTVGTRGGNFVVQSADLLLNLGSRLNIRTIGYNRGDFAKNAYKISIDIDPEELKKPSIKIDMPICADLKNAITTLLNLPYKENAQHSAWLKWCKDINNKYPACLKEYYQDKVLNPYVAINELFNALTPNTNIVCSNGSACVISFQVCKIKQGQRIFTNSGCASMGYGLPASLGAAIAEPQKQTICLEGDGSIMMNLQELATVAYHKPNLKIFIINNNGYLSIRQTQTNLFKGRPLIGIDNATGVNIPNFKKIANAFGIKYYKIDKLKNLNKNYGKILAQDGPAIVELVVNYKQNFAPKLSSKVLPDGKIVSPTLDDMFPFLDKNEYESIKNSVDLKGE